MKNSAENLSSIGTASSNIFFSANLKSLAILSALLVLLCFLAHGASLWNGLTLGDYFQIQPFYGIEAKKWNEFWIELFTEGFIHPFSSPLARASLALDFQSAARDPALFHAVNVLLDAACVVSAFIFLVRLNSHFSAGKKASLLLPFLSCAIFAVHPISSDAVAHLGGRSALLTFFWYFLALHAFLTGFTAVSVGTGLLGYLFAYLSIVLAIFSGCQAISLPFTMIFVGLLIKPAKEGWKDWIYERAWEFGALLMVAIGLPFLFLLKSELPAGNGLSLPTLSASAYWATQFKVFLLYYLRIFFLPLAMTIAPLYAIAQGVSDPLAMLGIVSVLVCLALMYRFKNQAFIVLGLYLLVVGLVPQGAVVQAEYAAAERFYLSSLGLALIFSSAVTPWLQNQLVGVKNNKPGIPVLAVVLLLISLTALANWRDHAYSTNSALLRGALRLDPADNRTRALLAFLLTTDKGVNIERGAIEAERVLKKESDLPAAYLARGTYNRWRKNRARTVEDFELALKLALEQKLSPEIVLSAKSGLAQAIADSGTISDPKRLQELAKSALTLYPSEPRLYLALGKGFLAENRPESAELACRQFDRGRRFDRLDVDFNEPYVRAALSTGYPFRFDIAYGAARTANKILQSDESEVLLARAALETGRIRKGIDMMRLYLSHAKQPSAEALKVTAGLAKQLGDPKTAAEYMARARAVDPDVDKHVRLFMTVAPKPAKEDEYDTPAAPGSSDLLMPKPKGK